MDKTGPYILASGNKSLYRIAIDPMASESEKWAAGELQHWLKEITGADLPVQEISESYSDPQIIIGYNNIIKKITVAELPAKSDESFRYFSSGPDIYIYGGNQRGSMYGVMTFLENELGCRQSMGKRQSMHFTLMLRTPNRILFRCDRLHMNILHQYFT